MTSNLAGLIASRFIQRRDVKAIQFDNGDYVPDLKMRDKTRHGQGFKMSHLKAHLEGSETYGHYLIDANNKARIFCLDIDLEKVGAYPILPDLSTAPADGDEAWLIDNTQLVEVTKDDVTEGKPTIRDAWADRRNLHARNWYKMQMKTLASRFASVITKDLQLPCAVTYSGNKGVHVYGFLGESDAKDCREAGLLALDLTDEWELSRGKNFYRHRNPDPMMGYPSFSVEIFPKQDSLEDKDLGNLLRLPLGVNRKKPKDPTFFLDMTGPMGEFKPHANPVMLLESGDPFQ